MTTQCSVEWDDAGLPAWGTAKEAQVIVAVESAGSWGRDAVGDAGLRSPKGATLYVVRSPGRHAEKADHRRVFVSGGFDKSPWLVSGMLSETEVLALLRSDVASTDIHQQFGLVATDHPILLICTNGRRDACCAVRGRPLALAGHAAAPGSVWEVSHIGGHKLAPTAIHLPSGQTFGRLREGDAATLARLELTETVPAELFSRTMHRGRVDLSSASQVAETWWREQHPDLALGPVPVGRQKKTADGIEVELPDGSALLVTSERGPELRESCAKGPKKAQYFAASLRS